MKKLSDVSVRFVKGVGPAKLIMLERLGIESIEDLLYFFPRRYEDRRNITPISQLQIGETQTITGKVVSDNARKSWYTKKHVFEVVLDDGGGKIVCVWFNQPYLSHYFKVGQEVVCYGRVEDYKNRMQMISPEYELLQDKDNSLSVKRIVPIYSLTRGITQRFLRRVIDSCIEIYQKDLIDELSVPLRNKLKLANIRRSIHQIHFPENFDQQEEALKRISFEEFFFFQISVILRRLSLVQSKGVTHIIKDADALGFIDGFDFELTGSQLNAIRDIRLDMEKKSPMLRLLQGDVGCGKTLVALFGCVMAIQEGYQSCIMAPTEILARQHYETVVKLFSKESVGSGSLAGMTAFETLNPKVALLTSNLKKQEKEDLLKKIKKGEIDFVIGTHALINEDVQFKKLSFAVIDEQHKFGVRQRALLSKKGSNPDVLIMTATPIPRTLCITLYGDLDVSTIDEMPKGRGKIETRLYSPEKELDVYHLVKEEILKGHQCYIVYPLVEESEKLDLKAAQQMFKRFESDVFKDLRVALVHGQMKRKDSAKIMSQFKKGDVDVLVATTVLEVGVDVPNASVMVIEHAERFGLSQLHQLRGRIGRGVADSLCLLIGDPQTEDGAKRLKVICKTTDGFKIARVDLEIRGPGHFFGRHQHGLNELKVANPLTQLDILELARKEALQLTGKDPRLEDSKNKDIKQIIKRRYPTYLRDVEAG